MPPPPVVIRSATANSGIPQAFAERTPGSPLLVVRFAYAWLQVVLRKSFDGVNIDTLETLVVAANVPAGQAGLSVVDDSVILSKRSVAQGVGSRFATESGSIVLPVSRLAKPAQRNWTIIVRAKGSLLETGQAIDPRVVYALAVKLPVQVFEFPHISVDIGDLQS